MMNRRLVVLALGAMLALGACVPTQQVAPSLAQSLRVVDVSTTLLPTRELAVNRDRVVTVVDAALTDRLRALSSGGSRDVRADVQIDRIFITNGGAGALLGSTQSSITASISLIDVATGDVVVPAEQVSGTTEARPTIFGALAIQAPEQELQIISQDLAVNAGLVVFGQ